MQFKQGLDDRRTGVRLRFSTLVYLQPSGCEEVYQGESMDVSVSGMVVDCMLPENLINTDCSIKIVFPGSHSNLIIQDLTGKLVRSSNGGTGITFHKPLEWFLLFPVYQTKLSDSLRADNT